MACSDRDFCIKCERGGKLFVCSGSGCPIAAHEKCMGCPVRLDDMGNFYCPFCLYGQAATEVCNAKENAISKAKALSAFIDGDMKALLAFIDGEVMDCDERRKPKDKAEEDRNTKLGDGENVEESSRDDIESKLENYDVSSNSIRVEGYKEAELGLPNKSFSPFTCGRDDGSCEEGLQQFQGVGVQGRVEEQLTQQDGSLNFRRDANPSQENGNLFGSHIVQGEMSKSQRVDMETHEGNWSNNKRMQKETTASSSKDGSMLDGHLCKRRDSLISFQCKHIKENGKDKAPPSNANGMRRLLRVKGNAQQFEKANACSELRKLEESFNKSTKKLFPRGRRKKLLWTEEEEDMLKEGVRVFKSEANKNIPWRKILVFGQHIFDSTRTPEDLKDKWRNILAKEVP